MSFEDLKKQILLFSLLKISKHKSLFKNDTNTRRKKDKKKKNGERAYKRVTFVMVFCGINTNIMYELSCNEESQ